MTVLVSQDFNVGPDGTTVAPGDIGASAITGTAPVYNAAHAIEGTFCIYFPSTSTGSARWDFTPAALAWTSFYMHTPAAAPAGNESISTIYSGTTQLASIRYQTDGTFGVRDVNAALATTALAVPLDTDVRVAFLVQPGSASGVQIRVYWGANLHGTTANTSATTSCTGAGASSVDNVRLGTPTGGFAAYYDRLRIDNATEPAGMTVGPPVVNAGPDLTKEVGGPGFTIQALETPGANPISTRQWRVVSGTAVTLANATTDTVTVTPPATTGSTVLGYKATDSVGTASTEDTLTITWIASGQSLLPVADVASGSWTATPTSTPMALNIGEDTPDAGSFIASPSSPTGQEYKCRLRALTAAPATTSGVYVEAMLWLSATAASQSTVVTLYDSDGTTVRKTATFTDLTTTPTIRQIPLTSGEAAAITGWTAGLVLGIKATAA